MKCRFLRKLKHLFKIDKRVTVLLGAGAALELKYENIKPSTWNITKEALNNNVTSTGGKGLPLLQQIYITLCNEYGLVPSESYNKVHFEVIFHILEMLSTYWKSRISHRQDVDAPFEKLITDLKIKFNDDQIFPAKRQLLDTIWRIVNNYDKLINDSQNKWYRDFWRAFGNDMDVFNLNYDTTIENSIVDYEDGFEDIPGEGFKEFNINKLLKNSNLLSTINHIHGCILYGHERFKNINQGAYNYEFQDLYKYSTYDDAHKNWLGSSQSDDESQNGQELVQGPLITGLSKTDKLTCLPYDAYRYNFERSIIKNNSLLIIGYSFGDLYINHMLTRLDQLHGDKKRVVLIDYWNIEDWLHDNLDYSKGEPLRPDYFYRYSNSDNIPEKELLFIKRVVHKDNDVWEHFPSLSFSAPMISDNGQLMLFIHGFKDAVDNYKSDIIKFLNS